MAVSGPTFPLAQTVADAIASAATPFAVQAQRLALAHGIAASEPMSAALVVGSTALSRANAVSDLDIVLIEPTDSGRPRFETRRHDGLTVELERITEAEALAATDAADGWTWDLRAAARLGCGVIIRDPRGFAAQLTARADALTPDPDRSEATLRDVYAQLVTLGAADPPDGEALRGCLDNLVLLTLLDHSRRFQKPKWALADLIHAGEQALVDATLRAYGVGDTATVLSHASTFTDAALAAIGAPDHATLAAMGHAPDQLEASYVARTLVDARDLAAADRTLEAQYVARFAVRLAAALLCPPHAVMDLADAAAGHGLADLYAAAFDDSGVTTTLPPIALQVADARLATLTRRLADTAAVA